MASVNTEKPMGKSEQKRQTSPATKNKMKENIANAPIQSNDVKDEKPKEETKKTEVKKEKKKLEKKTKKEEVFVKADNVTVSTKVAISICKFIVGKRIENAIKELEEVTRLKRAIPMKGEYAHRKGKIMSGKFPVNASKEFIVLLKSLRGNANNHDVEDPIISEAVANKGSGVWASGGRTRKRTHIKIIAKEKKLINKKSKNKTVKDKKLKK